MAKRSKNEVKYLYMCKICLDEKSDVIQPCRQCTAMYCRDCLLRLFNLIVENAVPMPPKCCTVLQLYTVLPDFPEEQAQLYRAKFKAWLTGDKAYCPIPSCSALISPRYLPDQSKAHESFTSHKALTSVLKNIAKHKSSRFCRDDGFLNHHAPHSASLTKLQNLPVFLGM